MILSVKDSIRKLSTYVPSVHVSFKQDAAIEIGTKIIQKANEFGINFDDKTFREIFKGIYVKSDYGDGTVLYIDQAQMNVVYKCYAVDTLTGVKLKKKVLEEGDQNIKTPLIMGTVPLPLPEKSFKQISYKMTKRLFKIV